MRGELAKLSMAKKKKIVSSLTQGVFMYPKLLEDLIAWQRSCVGCSCAFLCVSAPAQLLRPCGCGNDCEQSLPKVFISNCLEYLITNLHWKGNSL